MKLIFIYGLPATGKLTVAQELVAITGTSSSTITGRGYAAFRIDLQHGVIELRESSGFLSLTRLQDQLPGLILPLLGSNCAPEFIARRSIRYSRRRRG